MPFKKRSEDKGDGSKHNVSYYQPYEVRGAIMHVAMCSCGWSSGPHEFVRFTVIEAQDHLESVK
jgi:hypothetical protein